MNNIVKIKSISKTEYDVTFKCPFCGELTTIAVPKVEYIDWESGQYHVQDCFRSLGPDEREQVFAWNARRKPSRNSKI